MTEEEQTWSDDTDALLEALLRHPGMGAHLPSARRLFDYRAQEGLDNVDDD
jgi:hypothetical protein